jgi:hypothetical protein
MLEAYAHKVDACEMHASEMYAAEIYACETYVRPQGMWDI